MTTDGKVMPFKLAEKEKPKTLIETLEKIIADWKEKEEIEEYEDLKIGLLAVEVRGGLRILPLTGDSTLYEHIGFLEAVKLVVVDNLYIEGEDE